MWHLKTTRVPVIVGALGMIKEETDKHINRISGSLSLYEKQKQKLHFAELLISLGDYYWCDWKILRKKRQQKT